MVRVKRRYIVVKIKFKGTQSQEAFSQEIKTKIGEIFGDFGVACLRRGFTIKRYDAKDGYMVICVRKGVHEMVMSSLPLVVQTNGMPCSANIIHLSGTLRCALRELKLNYLRDLRKSIAESQKKKNET